MIALCTRDQVKSRLGIKNTGNDSVIDELIVSATRTIQRRYGREFVDLKDDVSRLFALSNRYIDLAPYDLREATAVIVDPDGEMKYEMVAGTDYLPMPLNGDESTGTYLALKIAADFFYRYPMSFSYDSFYKFGFAQVQVTGDWGVWDGATDVAEDVRAAAIETVCAWLDQGASDIAGAGTLGDARHLGPAVQTSWDIPVSAHRKLMPYSRNLGVF